MREILKRGRICELHSSLCINIMHFSFFNTYFFKSDHLITTPYTGSVELIPKTQTFDSQCKRINRIILGVEGLELCP